MKMTRRFVLLADEKKRERGAGSEFFHAETFFKRSGARIKMKNRD